MRISEGPYVPTSSANTCTPKPKKEPTTQSTPKPGDTWSGRSYFEHGR